MYGLESHSAEIACVFSTESDPTLAIYYGLFDLTEVHPVLEARLDLAMIGHASSPCTSDSMAASKAAWHVETAHVSAHTPDVYVSIPCG